MKKCSESWRSTFGWINPIPKQEIAPPCLEEALRRGALAIRKSLKKNLKI